jgi:hypothetical protein
LIEKNICALPPKRLSLQSENGANEVEEVEIWGLYTSMDAKGISKVTQKFI